MELWAYKTTPKHFIELLPFHLVFGVVVVQLTEKILPTSRTKCVKEGLNDKVLLREKALLNETSLWAFEHTIQYQVDIKKHYDKRVKNIVFKPSDRVLNREVRVQE